MSHASGERKREILYIYLKNFEFFMIFSHRIHFFIWFDLQKLEEEYIKFLKFHHIPFDSRYVFD